MKRVETRKIISKIVTTCHGNIRTPFFMPDATRGFVKLTGGEELKKAGVKALVVNTLHLYLQPGLKIIKEAGGIHNFMNWNGPILSDSGGFQVFSLIHKNPRMGKIYGDKVIFKFPLDGSKHELTPEKSMQIQFDLGADMMVCLDDCPPNEFKRVDLEKSVERTIAWAKRCRAEYDKQIKKRKIRAGERPLLFSVIQGGAELDLRKKCIEGLMEVGFSAKGGPILGWDGYGFGARPVDKEGNFLGKVLKFTADLIPKDSLKFALGIGLPEDIIRSARMGWDIFDCVIPTREGRHGRLFLQKRNPKSEILNPKQIQNPCLAGRQAKSPPKADQPPRPRQAKRGGLADKIQNEFYKTININNAKFRQDFSPINPESNLPELRQYTLSYLHHLFKLKEPLGARLASLNNLEFYMELMEKIRKGK